MADEDHVRTFVLFPSDSLSRFGDPPPNLRKKLSEDALQNMTETLANKKNLSPDVVKARYKEDFIEFQNQNRALQDPVRFDILTPDRRRQKQQPQAGEEEEEDYDEDNEYRGLDRMFAEPAQEDQPYLDPPRINEYEGLKRMFGRQAQGDQPYLHPPHIVQNFENAMEAARQDLENLPHVARQDRRYKRRNIAGIVPRNIARSKRAKQQRRDSRGKFKTRSPVADAIADAAAAELNRDYRPSVRATTSRARRYRGAVDDDDSDDDNEVFYPEEERDSDDTDSDASQHSVLGPAASARMHAENPQLRQQNQNGQGFRWLRNTMYI